MPEERSAVSGADSLAAIKVVTGPIIATNGASIMTRSGSGRPSRAASLC